MADSAAFTLLCEELEERSPLDRLESRGTVRLALQRAGLPPATVSAEQLRVVVERILHDELLARGVANASEVCRALAARLASAPAEDRKQDPEAVFQRLGS